MVDACYGFGEKMDKIHKTAMFAVGRAVFFGGFAISLVMMAFAFDFLLAFRAGAILSLAMSAILLWFAQTAHNRPPEKSEVWLLLPADDKPKNDVARNIFTQVMHEVYLHYAARAFAFGAAFLVLAILLGISGYEIGLV
jgi:hypothetical protein